MSQSPMVRCAGYVFSVVSISEALVCRLPGVYLLCRREAVGVHILYIGQTDNVAERLGPSHEHWGAALRLGMNEVHLHFLAENEPQRRAVESDLLAKYPTPLNRPKPVVALAMVALEAGRATGAGWSLLMARLAGALATRDWPSLGLRFNPFRPR